MGELSDGVWAKRYHQIRAVYSTEGIAPTLCAGMGEGGGVVPKIMEEEIENDRMLKRALDDATSRFTHENYGEDEK